MPKADAVFEGGGVKGIGLVGALSVAEEEHGYTWQRVAGTSAGAIVAALLAVGYKAREIKEIMTELDYEDFKDTSFFDRFPVVGPLASLMLEKGIYEGDFLEGWLEDKLEAKGVFRFGQLGQEKRLRVITADITNERLVVLPDAAVKYGKNPRDLRIARAVRMSMSIPFFFEPVIWNGCYFVDGGILSNFPIWLFDSDYEPRWPTFGFRLAEPEYGQPNRIDGPLDFAAAVITTMMEAHDKLHVENEDWSRTIDIPTLDVQATDFDLSPEKAEALFLSGRQAAWKFFPNWDFETHKQHRYPGQSRKVKHLKKRMVA